MSRCGLKKFKIGDTTVTTMVDTVGQLNKLCGRAPQAEVRIVSGNTCYRLKGEKVRLPRVDHFEVEYPKTSPPITGHRIRGK